MRGYNIQGNTGYLTWNDNSNSEDEFIIEIEVIDGEDIYWEEWDRSDGSWYQLTGLAHNASYTFRVSATNQVGTSAPTSPAVESTQANVANGSYPISRHLYFYWISTARPELQQFVQWVTSPEGQKLVENVGYFPLSGAPQTATQ